MVNGRPPYDLPEVYPARFSNDLSRENAIAAIEGLVASSCVPRGWANVQAVFMKTNASAALPLYAAMPDPNEDRAAREEEKAAKDARKAERDEAKNASGGR